MKVRLLYPDREWNSGEKYYDHKNVINDLGLDILFRTAAREQVEQDGTVQTILDSDKYIENAMMNIMMVPLKTENEMVYRQDILKDCVKNPDFISELYAFATETSLMWERLGKHQNEKTNDRNAAYMLVSDIYLLRMFVERLDILIELISNYKGAFCSAGINNFIANIREKYSPKIRENVKTVLDDISFYVDGNEDGFKRDRRRTKKACIVMGCDIADGLKLGNFKLEEVETLGKKYRKHSRQKSLMQLAMGALVPGSSYPVKEDIILGETMKLEYQVVYYLMSCMAQFMNSCKTFFDQLYIQSAFYKGAVNLKARMDRHELPIGYPKLTDKRNLCFMDLKDLSMAIEQLSTPVGNSCEIINKDLLIVTGANQGGKSTFLRSIGIAQVMMQAGLFVAASGFCSGIYTSMFTHFTRREDSEMNSGRLDEELGRMSKIIDRLDENSLVLLNESFATTTEKEGSVIAYDIIKALVESGVKVLTVTHLLSFAKKVYEEGHDNVEFLCAERKDDGKRTFKMIQHEPELTSFGLDLYEQVIG